MPKSRTVHRVAPVLWRAALLCGAWLAAAGPAAAHPHGWIDVWSTLEFDDKGQPVALRQVWLFDEYYSAFAVEGLDQDGDGAPDPKGLEALLEENLSNLAAYDYFTRIERNGLAVGIGEAAEASSRMRGDRLEMSFLVPIAKPEPIGDAALSYAIFDPTYYIEMLHAEEDTAVRLVGAPPGCGFALSAPMPDPETVALASMLDRTESAGDTLGAQFAEQVAVQCGAR